MILTVTRLQKLNYDKDKIFEKDNSIGGWDEFISGICVRMGGLLSVLAGWWLVNAFQEMIDGGYGIERKISRDT